MCPARTLCAGGCAHRSSSGVSASLASSAFAPRGLRWSGSGGWKASWKSNPPAWLGRENPEWPGNYPVRFWQAEWKQVLLAEDGPLARLIAAGFDGIYLDKVDVHQEWAEAGALSEAEAENRMAIFVREIAAFARARRAGFLVILQNGSEVAARADVLPHVDGLALEDTFYDGERRQDPAHTREVLANARRVRAAGKPVLAVDYCRTPGKVSDFYERAAGEGFVPYSTVRDLDRYVAPLGE